MLLLEWFYNWKFVYIYVLSFMLLQLTAQIVAPLNKSSFKIGFYTPLLSNIWLQVLNSLVFEKYFIFF